MSYTVNSEMVSIRCSRCGNHVFLSDVLRDETTPRFYGAVESGGAVSDIQNEVWTVKMVNAGANKLMAVKTVKDITGLGLKESKEIVDLLQDVVTGVSIKKAEEIKSLLHTVGVEVQIINQRS